MAALGDAGLPFAPTLGGDAGMLPCSPSPAPSPFGGDVRGLSAVAEHHAGGPAVPRAGHGPSAGWAARGCRPASAPAPGEGGKAPGLLLRLLSRLQ